MSERTDSPIPPSLFEEIARRTIVNGECWEWQGYRHADGYGCRMINGKVHRVHRVVWQLWNGPIHGGLFVCHRCDNPPCCNPAHLFLGTNRDNLRDAAAKKRLHRPDNRGERSGMAKLNELEVREIFSSEEPAAICGARFGVAKSTVLGIREGLTWKHLKLARS